MPENQYGSTRREFLINSGSAVAFAAVPSFLKEALAHEPTNPVESFKRTLLNYAEIQYKKDGSYGLRAETVRDGKGIMVTAEVEIKDGKAILKQPQDLVLLISNRPQNPLKWSEDIEYIKARNYGSLVDTYKKGDKGQEIDVGPKSEFREQLQKRFEDGVSALERMLNENIRKHSRKRGQN